MKDFLIITSDAGNLTILEFGMKDENFSFKVLINEKISKTGCRRISQGFFITTDLLGRGIFLSSTE